MGHHVDDIVNQVSEEYGDLEKLSEGELMEILKSLEADEEDEENSLEEVRSTSSSSIFTIKHPASSSSSYMPDSRAPWWSSK